MAERITLYYDPIEDVHLSAPIASALQNQLFVAPLEPEDARRIYDAAASSVGFFEEDVPRRRLTDPRLAAGGLFLAKEFGLDEVAARLSAGIDAIQQPTWDDDRGEFIWGCQLDEPHPRGQYNAWLAAAEANSAGGWTRLATERLPEHPMVEGLDFPRVALNEARWEGEVLRLGLQPNAESAAKTTSFRVVGLRQPSSWTVRGATGAESRVDGDALIVTASLRAQNLEIRRRAQR